MRIPTPDREGQVKIVSCTSSVARMEKILKKKKTTRDHTWKNNERVL